MTREQKEFLLHYDGDLSKADPEFVNELLRHLSLEKKWAVSHIEDAHTGAITALAFNPDGTKLATAGSDRVIRVWNVATKELLATSAPIAPRQIGYILSIEGLEFVLDDSTLIVTFNEKNVHNTEHAQYCEAWSIYNGRVISGARDDWELVQTPAAQWCLRNHELGKELFGHLIIDQAPDICQSADGRVLAVKDAGSIAIQKDGRTISTFSIDEVDQDSVFPHSFIMTLNKDGQLFAAAFPRSPDFVRSPDIFLKDIATNQSACFGSTSNKLVFSSNNILAAVARDSIIFLTPLPIEHQLLLFKAERNPVLENSIQRERLQNLLEELSEKEKRVILAYIPLLKKEYDDTDFAHVFFTEPIVLRSHDGAHSTELLPIVLQKLLSKTLLAQQICGWDEKSGERLVFTLPEEFTADWHVVELLREISCDTEAFCSLTAQEQFDVLRIWNYLCCLGYMRQDYLSGIINADAVKILFVQRHALDRFGSKSLMDVLSIPQVKIGCWFETMCFPKWLVGRNSWQGVHVEHVLAMSFSQQGHYFAVMADDGLRVWDLYGTGTCRHYHVILPAAAHSVQIAWNPVEEKELAVLFVNSFDSKRCIIIKNEGTAEANFPDSITNLMYLNARILAAFSREAQQIYLYDIDEKRITQTIPIADRSARCMALSPDRNTLAVGRTNGTINLVNPNSPTLEHLRAPLIFDTAPIVALAFSPDGTLFTSCALDGTLRVYEVATGDLRATYHSSPRPVEPVLMISPDKKYLLFTRLGSTTRFDLDSGEETGSCGKKILDPAGVWYASCFFDDVALNFYFPHELAIEQYLLLEKAWSEPGLFSEYLTPEERSEIDQEQLKKLEWQQKDYLAHLYRQLPENLQKFVRARMPWIGE